MTVAVSRVRTATNCDLPSHLPMAKVEREASREGCKEGSRDVSLNDFSIQGSKIRWGGRGHMVMPHLTAMPRKDGFSTVQLVGPKSRTTRISSPTH